MYNSIENDFMDILKKYRGNKLWFYSFIILVSLFWAFKLRYFLFDDAYFGFNYARNLIEGNGFVFNPGEKVIGTSAPLPAMLYAVIGLLTHLEVPLIAKIISTMALMAAGLFAFEVFTNWTKSRWWGLFGWALIFNNAWILLLFSHESMIYLALIWIGFYLAMKDRWFLLSVILGIGVLVRQEIAILWAILFAVQLCKKIIKGENVAQFMTNALVFILMFAWWFLFSKFYYGTWFSQSMWAKSIQTKVGIQNYYRGFAFGVLESFKNFPLYVAYYIGGLMLLLPFVKTFKKNGPVLVITFWAGILSLFYMVLHMPYYHWFGIQIFIMFGIIYMIGLRQILSKKSEYLPVKIIAVSFLIISIFANLGLSVRMINAQPSKQALYYKSLGDWFKANTSENSSICYGEVGMMRYYSDRKIVDYIGMVTPGTIPYLVSKDFRGLINEYRPDYFVYTKGFEALTGKLPEESWFNDEYVLKQVFNPNTFPLETMIFERKPILVK